MEQKLTEFLLRWRHWLAILSVLLTAILGFGARDLFLESDYKIYFEEDEPQLVAHEAIQDTYTSTDNLAILLRPKEGDLFNPRSLTAIYELTEHAWQTPFVMRVDSITNFQHTEADGDDLLVEDLVLDPADLDDAKIAKVKRIALSEKQLVNRMVSADGKTALVNINLELPPEVDKTADLETQKAQRAKRDASHPEIVEFGRAAVRDFQSRYPELEMHIAGVSMITNSFNESAQRDASSLVPLMYLVIMLLLIFFFRSVGSVVATLLVIACASIAAVGSAGWIGYPINTVNVMTPTIVLTIAVCDAVHLLSVYLRGLGEKMTPVEAMAESLRLNLQPIILTSITTAVGFLTLNFSISPPFVELGNMTAIGVMWAMVLTFTLLPAVVMLLTRKGKMVADKQRWMTRYAHWVVANRHKALIVSVLSAALLISFLPRNQLDDDPIAYFQRGVPFRESMEFSIKYLPGVKDINFTLDCGAASCVSDPGFLTTLDEFSRFLEAQPYVVHVGSYVDVIKRLNRSMNGDDPAYYAIPERADLAAQYNLMYEMSLPYGLDLNNQLNLDKSATKVSVMTQKMTNLELIDLAERSHQWLKTNYQPSVEPGSSVSLMFAHIGANNIRSMLWGGLFAIIGVTITILIALRSFRYALISMIPNAIPAFMAFGLWGLLIGQVNMAVAAVFSISLGILVDDTVHFISKYRRARQIKGLSPEAAIHYAFENVGSALIVTTVVLAFGFGVLATSDFNLNAMSGSLTAITIIIALIFDFLILPPILMLFDREPTTPS